MAETGYTKGVPRRKTMEINEPVSPKKDKTWIWILAGAVILCMCLVVVAGGVGAYMYLNQRPAEIAPLPEEQPPLQPSVETVVVEPYEPSPADTTRTLAGLAPNYQGSTVPGVHSWEVSVSSSQPVAIYFGWCTTTPAILEQNFEHIQFLIDVDDEPVDVGSLYVYNESLSDQVCRAIVGIVRQWPLGEHIIRVNMHFDAAINDGMGDYPAGDYVDIFNVTVTP